MKRLMTEIRWEAMWPTDIVVRTATEWHAGQLDKNGMPYIGHLERTARMVELSGGKWFQIQAAWLHDIIEDTAATELDLLAAGISSHVVALVSALTHEPFQLYQEYLQQVKAESAAVLVKLCDLYDNLNPSRMQHLDGAAQRRLRNKYGLALVELSS